MVSTVCCVVVPMSRYLCSGIGASDAPTLRAVDRIPLVGKARGATLREPSVRPRRDDRDRSSTTTVTGSGRNRARVVQVAWS